MTIKFCKFWRCYIATCQMVGLRGYWTNGRFAGINLLNAKGRLTFSSSLNCFDENNGISTHLGVFYANRLGHHVHCTFIFTSFINLVFKRFFAHSLIKWNYFKRDLYETLTSVTTMDQSGSWSNKNDEVLDTPQITRTEASLLDSV